MWLIKLENEYDIEIKELDYDFDDVEKYNPGKILPVLIFYKNDNWNGKDYVENIKKKK